MQIVYKKKKLFAYDTSIRKKKDFLYPYSATFASSKICNEIHENGARRENFTTMELEALH